MVDRRESLRSTESAPLADTEDDVSLADLHALEATAGLGSNAHHVKYTDAEALTQANAAVATHAALANAHHSEAHTLGSHSGTLDHGTDLTGQADDDHTQYLTVARHDADDHSGLAASELPNHASRHERGGADQIDGDHLDIDFTPSNYTPSTTPAEAANVDDLAAHLAGIDNAIGGAWDVIGSGAVAASGTPIDVSSISADYDLFRLIALIDTGGTGNLQMRFNADTGSNYLWNQMSMRGQTSTAFTNSNGGSSPSVANLTGNPNADDRVTLDITFGQYDADRLSGICHYMLGAKWEGGVTWFSWDNAAKVNRVQLICADSVSGGTYLLLGRKQ